MILSGPRIREEVRDGNISITPFSDDLVNPASVDLRLGDTVGVYRLWAYRPEPYPLNAPSIRSRDEEFCRGILYPNKDRFIDTRNEKDYELETFKIVDKGLILKPGILYLMHTVERVCTTKFVPVLDGKSSIGRLGVVIHLTAGYGDPGFDGQYTLEVSVIHSVRVYAGMRFCQMRFHALAGDVEDYRKRGHYTRGDAMGPVASKAYTQFKEKR